MVTPQYVKEMAKYNRWQNDATYKLCQKIGEEERKKNRGMFFGSIHATLNHIIAIDTSLYELIKTGKPKYISFEAIPYVNFEDLRYARAEFDNRLVLEAEGYSQDWLNLELDFENKKLGKLRKMQRSFFFMHMFNHQTHHRSQVTSEFHKTGLNYGSTDITFNPELFL
ncbi:MAG: DinB family protein [Oligoflexales bacterium]